jgi:hypothetical protein
MCLRSLSRPGLRCFGSLALKLRHRCFSRRKQCHEPSISRLIVAAQASPLCSGQIYALRLQDLCAFFPQAGPRRPAAHADHDALGSNRASDRHQPATRSRRSTHRAADRCRRFAHTMRGSSATSCSRHAARDAAIMRPPLKAAIGSPPASCSISSASLTAQVPRRRRSAEISATVRMGAIIARFARPESVLHGVQHSAPQLRHFRHLVPQLGVYVLDHLQPRFNN